MRCCVLNCKNDSRRLTKPQRITFHVFPKEPLQRKAWLKALGKESWEPKDRSAVCSEHFSCEDLYETSNGMRNVRNGAVPLIQVCRVCLVVNVKLFPIRGCELEQEYKNLTGIHLSQHVGFPQKLCAECIQRLLNYSRFRHKSLRANLLLMEIIKTHGNLTCNSIQSINRESNQLCSSLSTKYFQPDHYDAYILEIDESNQEIIDDKLSIKELNLYSPIKNEEDEMFISDESSDINAATDVNYVIKTENDSKTGDDTKTEDDDTKTEDDDTKTEDDDTKTEDDDTKTEDVSMIDEFDQDSNTSDTCNNYTTDNTLITVTNLTIQEQIAEILKRKDSSNYKNSSFKCTECFKGFLDEDTYQSHMIKHTDQYGKYECGVCKTHFNLLHLLNSHINSCHCKRYSCNLCTFVTTNSHTAKLHERYHKGTMYSCPHCEEKFLKFTTYLSHLRIQHPSDFVCELCGYSFIGTKGLQMHKKKKHRFDDSQVVPEDGPSCMDCNIKFLNDGALAVHLKLCTKRKDLTKRMRNDGHSGKRRYPTVNGSRYRAGQTVCTHAPVTCEQCGLELRNLRVYAHHFRRSHPNLSRTIYNWPVAAPIMCEQCGKIFRCRTLLNAHMWIHTGEKPYKCEHCSSRFTQKSHLKFHIQAQHSATPPTYECAVCGKNFYNAENRARHMLIHTGRTKSYVCEVCGKGFNTPTEKRTHTEHVHMKKPWPKRMRMRRIKQEPEESAPRPANKSVE